MKIKYRSQRRWYLKARKKKQNWSSPGEDKITNNWKRRMKTLIAAVLNGHLDTPSWFTSGRSFMVREKDNPSAWSDYTNYISELTLQTDYVSNTRLFRITRGKDRLMQIDKGGCTAGKKHWLCWQLVDWENGTRRCTPSKEEISCCLVDAKTAFDSVSHQWILIRTLEFYGLHNSVIHLINMP